MPNPAAVSANTHRVGVSLGVVGQHPLDHHAVFGEEGGCLDQEAGRGGGLLISQDLAEGDPGAVIDGRVDVVIADARPPSPAGPAMIR
jgi:hypothetical protein